MRFFQLGKKINFYEDLEEIARCASVQAKELHDLVVHHFENPGPSLERISRLKKKAAEHKMKMAVKVDHTFVTPMDKEDLETLTYSLDRICDAMYGLVTRLSLYPQCEKRSDLLPMIDRVVEITHQNQHAVELLAHRKKWAKLSEVIGKILLLEEEADQAFRQALARLFQEESMKAVHLILWRDLYEWVETVSDRTEIVANLLQRIVVKYA